MSSDVSDSTSWEASGSMSSSVSDATSWEASGSTSSDVSDDCGADSSLFAASAAACWAASSSLTAFSSPIPRIWTRSSIPASMISSAE